MVEILLIVALCYVLFGFAVLAYEMIHEPDCVDDLREHGLPLIALVVLLWPVFVWAVLRDEL